jgi:hypothetical protein
VSKGLLGHEIIFFLHCVQNIFVLTNYEEEKESQESEANDDDAMMR